MYIVAIPKPNYADYAYDWIGTFTTAEAAETYSIKFEDSIVVYGVEDEESDE